MPVNFDTVASVLEWLGLVAFAITGAVVAARKQMDIVGLIVLGTITAIGGGTLRDIFLGQLPVFWVRQPLYLFVCLVISAAMFFMPQPGPRHYRIVLWIDALGLGLFAVTGAERALAVDANPYIAILMGVITASFGGIIRDIFANETPVVLSYEIYILAALAAAACFVGLYSFGAPRDLALGGGLVVGAFLRGLALQFNWSLPRYTRS
jgi:uncharacterized membrane protein YeiH